MERLLIEKLVAWKHSPTRKPLVLDGARQVGKTWLLKQFGATEYKNCVYVNCDHNPLMDSLFSDYDIKRILLTLSAQTNQQIIPGETLVIFDEIQESPIALTAMKYFCEEAPEYHIAVAGSLLGLQVHSGTGFPVGKVDRLSLTPLSFKEFLLAMGEKILVDYLEEGKWDQYVSLKAKLVQLLREYSF